jgi:hypothetical protein
MPDKNKLTESEINFLKSLDLSDSKQLSEWDRISIIENARHICELIGEDSEQYFYSKIIEKKEHIIWAVKSIIIDTIKEYEE